MARPTFLVAEPEPGSAISARKLVLETAKFNVVTAHSSDEALEFFNLSPALHAAMIITFDLPNASKTVAKIKKAVPDFVVICLSPNRSTSIKLADHHCNSHDPEALVELCRKLFGDPRTKKE